MSCQGDCCVTFPISSKLPTLTQKHQEGWDLLAMLIPLTHDEAVERRQRFGIPLPVGPSQHYMCGWWDENTRLCTNYEARPDMCRYYPYDNACEHGCDCDAGRPPRLWQGDQA